MAVIKSIRTSAACADRSGGTTAASLSTAAAKQLLASSDLGYESVGERVGYADPSAFRLLFKRRTGLTPREYRRQFCRALVAGA